MRASTKFQLIVRGGWVSLPPEMAMQPVPKLL